MKLLTLALLLGLTACAPDGSSSTASQQPETVRGEPVQPQPQPLDAEPTDPSKSVSGEPGEPSDAVRGEPVEPPPQPLDAESTDPSKTVHGEPVEPQPRAPSTPDPSPARRVPEELLTKNEIHYGCKTSADCEVKNVGNCCGYYPACVNKDSPTFPDKVKAACAAEGTNSICGFPEIGSCDCIEGRCAPVAGAGGGGDVR